MEYIRNLENKTYHLDVFENCQLQKTITFPTTQSYYYLAVVMGGSDIDLIFASGGEQSCMYANCLTIPSSGVPCKVHIQGYLSHNYSTTHLHMVTMLVEGSDATVHGGVSISPKITKAEGKLLEENVVLGNKVNIHTLPQLDVRSHDVTASHGASIQKLDHKKLFYLQSKGLEALEAKRLILKGFVEQMFSVIQDVQSLMQEGLLDELQKEVMERVLNL